MDQRLPPGWELKHSKSHDNRPYYFNTATGQSQWDAPSAEETVHAYHILLKHGCSRRPSSWRQEHITLSEQDAITELKDIEARIKASGDAFAAFKAAASERSDCSSAKRGGDLGPFGRGQMQKPFEDAAYALRPGQMSGIVSTDSGVHIIFRYR